MKYIYLILIFLLFFSYNSFSQQNNIKLGISPPFMRNRNVNTLFFHKQFIFEFMSNFEEKQYSLEILNVEYNEMESVYLKKCKDVSYENDVEYLLYSVVYSIANKLYFKVVLLNPYNDVIIFSQLFQFDIENNINEFISDATGKLIAILKEIKLEKIQIKKTFVKKTDNEEVKLDIKNTYKHEVFVLNGFFKNHPLVMSFMSWFVGYNFSPFNIFNVEGAVFWGGGYFDTDFKFDKIHFNDFFVGTYASFNFFLVGVVEPTLGLRFEISYIVNRDVYFTLPIDMGLKIKVSKKDLIRINSSFQFNYFNIMTQLWEKSFTVGFMVGYARKI